MSSFKAKSPKTLWVSSSAVLFLVLELLTRGYRICISTGSIPTRMPCNSKNRMCGGRLCYSQKRQVLPFGAKTQEEVDPMPRIMLTGYIYRNTDGMYVSHCNELDTDTWAQSLDEAKRLTPDMIDTYFLMAAKIGMLQEVLAKLSAPNEASASATNVHGKWLATPVSDNGMHFAAKFEAVQAAA